MNYCLYLGLFVNTSILWLSLFVVILEDSQQNMTKIKIMTKKNYK